MKKEIHKQRFEFEPRLVCFLRSLACAATVRHDDKREHWSVSAGFQIGAPIAASAIAAAALFVATGGRRRVSRVLHFYRVNLRRRSSSRGEAEVQVDCVCVLYRCVFLCLCSVPVCVSVLGWRRRLSTSG